MSRTMYYYETGRAMALPHDPGSSHSLGPRPSRLDIGLQDAKGQLNLAALQAFSMPSNYVPRSLASPGVGRKDSLDNYRETREFGVEPVTRPLAESMNKAAPSGRARCGGSSWAQLTPVRFAQLIAVYPVCLESPVSVRIAR